MCCLTGSDRRAESRGSIDGLLDWVEEDGDHFLFFDNLSSNPSSRARMPSSKRRSAGESMSSSASAISVGYLLFGSDLNQRRPSSRRRFAEAASPGCPRVSSSTKPTTYEFITKAASAMIADANPALCRV